MNGTRRPTRRAERVGALLRQAIAGLLQRETKDPRLAQVIVTDVDLSSDLRHARILYRVLDGVADPARVQTALERAAGFLQGAIGRELRLRYTPELRFEFDPNPDRIKRLEELLADTRGDDLDPE